MENSFTKESNQYTKQSNTDNSPASSATKDNQLVGIKALINKALESYEKLPMLDVVFEKFARLLSTSLRNLTEYNVDLEVKNIQSLRLGSFLNTIPIPTIINIFRVTGQDNFGILVTNDSLISSFIEILFGEKKSTSNSLLKIGLIHLLSSR